MLDCLSYWILCQSGYMIILNSCGSWINDHTRKLNMLDILSYWIAGNTVYMIKLDS